MPKELSADEVRTRLLCHLKTLVRYWDEQVGDKTPREKLDGLVHSFLATLDGCSPGLPGFIIAPYPHPDDKAFCQARGLDWFPDNDPATIACDIGGGLHEQWHRIPDQPRRQATVVSLHAPANAPPPRPAPVVSEFVNAITLPPAVIDPDELLRDYGLPLDDDYLAHAAADFRQRGEHSLILVQAAPKSPVGNPTARYRGRPPQSADGLLAAAQLWERLAAACGLAADDRAGLTFHLLRQLHLRLRRQMLLNSAQQGPDQFSGLVVGVEDGTFVRLLFNLYPMHRCLISYAGPADAEQRQAINLGAIA